MATPGVEIITVRARHYLVVVICSCKILTKLLLQLLFLRVFTCFGNRVFLPNDPERKSMGSVKFSRAYQFFLSYPTVCFAVLELNSGRTCAFPLCMCLKSTTTKELLRLSFRSHEAEVRKNLFSGCEAWPLPADYFRRFEACVGYFGAAAMIAFTNIAASRRFHRL